jgi:hypothetical protein
MNLISDIARVAVSLGLQTGDPRSRGGTARHAMPGSGRAGCAVRQGRPFQMVNVGDCDGALIDDVTPWLHRISR